MALTWYWDSKIGCVKRPYSHPKYEGKYYYTSLYQGNAFLIEIYEDEMGDEYTLTNFIVGEQHVKNLIKDNIKSYGGCRVILLQDSLPKNDLKKLIYYLVMLGASVEVV